MFSEFLRGYLDCAKWLAERESDYETIDSRNLPDSAIDDATLEEIKEDCRSFYDDQFDHISEHAESAGHDFHLSRNRHGAGFNDGQWTQGETLHNAAKVYSTFVLVRREDDTLYHHN